MPPPFAILTVEDAFLVGLQLKRDIESLGYEVLGPAPTTEAALALVDHPQLAFAILDINLGIEDSIPVARALQERNIPFLFITGYDSVAAAEFEGIQVIRKPASSTQITEAIKAAIPQSEPSEPE